MTASHVSCEQRPIYITEDLPIGLPIVLAFALSPSASLSFSRHDLSLLHIPFTLLLYYR